MATRPKALRGVPKSTGRSGPLAVVKLAGVGHDVNMPDPSNPFAVLEALLPPGHRPEPAPRAPRGDRPQGAPRGRGPRPAPEPEGPPTPPTKLHEALRPGKAGFDALRYASWHGKASPVVVAYLELLAERFPSPHDQSFIKRAAERGELARGLMRRLAKLAKQHGMDAPELAEELGRAARSLAFWPGFPEAAKRLLAKVVAGEEDPVEGVGRYDRIEPTWSQRRGRGEAQEEGAPKEEGAAPAASPKAAKRKADAPATEQGPRAHVLAPFVRQKAGDHRVWNQSPSEAWVLHAAPGVVGWAGLLVPRPVSRELPAAPEGFSLDTADAAQLGQLLQELADGELGVLGVVLPGAEGLEALIAWAMRLLPLAGETKLEVIAAVAPSGPSVKAAGQAAVKALARTDAGRAKAIRLSAHPGKPQAGPVHALALAQLCFDAHPLAREVLAAAPWVGACLIGAPWPARAAYDALSLDRMPSQDALTQFLAAAHRVTAGSVEALVSELLVERLRADAKLCRHHAEAAARGLRLGDDLLAVGRVAALLGAADPQLGLPPALQLGALLARLESGEADAGAAAGELAQRLIPEDARLACAAEIIRAELALAHEGPDAAEAILKPWLALAPEVPGLAQWLALHRTQALVQAARDDKEGALATLAQARQGAEGLLDATSRKAILATLAMAEAAIDPQVRAEELALLVESERLLAQGEQALQGVALALADALAAPEATASAEAAAAPAEATEGAAVLNLMLEGEGVLLKGEQLLREPDLLEGVGEALQAKAVEDLSLLMAVEGVLGEGESLLADVAQQLAEGVAPEQPSA